MRLLEIKIKNIASLKGEHHISFKEVMAASPLFAITGETGSGKSSILNSIGLALYGNIFKKSVQQNDVVTLGEKEGQIELLFQAKEKTYLASWRARVRKQNGELYATPQSPNRDLYEVHGTSFESPKIITDKKVEDILHLDFDQFCKCVILNQGEFARFLSSSFTERKDILEKLYPGEILEGLSGELHREREATRVEKERLDVEMKTLEGSGQNGDELREKKKGLTRSLKLHEEIHLLTETLDQHYKTLYHYFEENQKNKLKLDATRKDIADLTSLQNDNLVALKHAQEAFEAAKKKQDQELPRLQDLLKLEEKERGLVETMKSQSTKLERLNLSLAELTKRTTDLKARESALALDLKGLEEKLIHPVLELKTKTKEMEALIDLFHELTRLRDAHQNAKENVEKLEEAGKEKARELQDVLKRKELLPKDLTLKLQEAQTRKTKLSQERDAYHRAEVQSTEIQRTLETLATESKDWTKKQQSAIEQKEQLLKEIVPLRTTKKLSGLLHAVALCRNHETTVEQETCPVCETKLSGPRWQELRASIDEDEINAQVELLEQREKDLLGVEHDLTVGQKTLATLAEAVKTKTEEFKSLATILDKKPSSETEIEGDIQALTQKKWELDQVLLEEKKLQDVLQKSREEFARVRADFQSKATLLEKKEAEGKNLLLSLSGIVKTLDQDSMSKLRQTLSGLKDYREKEVELHRSEQELKHSEVNLGQTKSELEILTAELKENNKTRSEYREELVASLGEQKASDKIQSLVTQVKELEEEFKKKDQNYRKLDLSFKEASGRLTQLTELLKEIELQFIKARTDLRESAKADLSFERPSLNRLLQTLRVLDLSFESPQELFVPVKELLITEKEFFKKEVTTQREALAATGALLAEWEKRQDKLTLLSLKEKDLSEKLSRLDRLYEVLGKDELRTFVLSLVEENLIAQTNEELQRLCQGRYEIVHQSRKMKITPEFYVLDKFREGGLRKVGTLSGGETFMVSLAMALALAEMTRGQAEIDSLFIDEGFGTLDQDSLEDVLEMLNQIQTRGLMVGIISHIKPLTNALPVNLLLSKRQDGTSTVSIKHN